MTDLVRMSISCSLVVFRPSDDDAEVLQRMSKIADFAIHHSAILGEDGELLQTLPNALGGATSEHGGLLEFSGKR